MTPIEEYIQNQDEAIRPILNDVYHTLQTVLPGTTEKISWQMPTFRKDRNLIHFAAQKKHLGVYPGAEAIEHFAPEFQKRGLRFSKGAVQFPYKDEIPLDFIAEIAVWCLEQEENT